MSQPAWSWGGSGEQSDRVVSPLLASITREAAFGGSTGKGVRVAIVDSGVDDEHPAVAGSVRGWVEPSLAEDGAVTYVTERHGDAFGHGTACAGIIHAIAPEAEIYSVRVLGPRLSGKGPVFAAGLRWAAENGMQIVNLSLGTTKRDFFGLFHDIADTAYHRGVTLVTAANNMPEPSFPSLFASVLSVACHAEARGDDPLEFYCNPDPPVEFGAHGIDARVAWARGSYSTMTGNSFAAPHITGVVALLRAKHPDLRPYEVKAVLAALARNARATGGAAP
ncbi:MAG: S8 family serine peptidase [Polyangiaceae bacterium]|jgi:subtilisin family serine protease